MTEKDSCVQPAKGPILEPKTGTGVPSVNIVPLPTVTKVGKAAPDFEVTAFIKDEGFKNVKLSDYKGQWVVLCFYPGDFTFV